MIKNATNPKVDFYFFKPKKWERELEHLRKIVLDCGLTEELKWGCPCYLSEKKNIVLIHVFKEYCALLFFKGALINDVNNILIQQTENVQAARQIRFTNTEQIREQMPVIKTYINEAIKIEKAGLKVVLAKTTDLIFPEEFQKKLDEMPALKKAFYALSPGRQRGYNLYFSAPIQSKTKQDRIKKYIPQILEGRGLNDA